MSLLNDVQKFIEAHPGCTSGDIADAFAGYSRQRVLQSASKLRQSGRVAHRCEGDTRRHFPRLTERAQEPEPQPVRETRPVRNFYVGTNDPRVILLTRQAEELESRGLYRRAATVWMAAFRESHSQPERNNFLAHRERCLRKSSKRAASGAGIENTPDGMQSQVLLAADRIAMVNPANGNTKPMFVGQGDQIFMNEVFLKYLTAPTITSGGNPPAFSLTPDGRLTAKNADISGSVNANSGTLNNVTINQNCTIKGMLEATQVRGDFVKAVSKAFPKKVGTWGNTETPNGTVTVTISDDHNFDRQIIIPPIIFNGIAYDDPGSGNNPGGTRYTGYGFEVRKNGVLIASRETKGAIPGSYSAVIDMPSGGGSVTLEFKIFQKGNQGAGNITDCTVIVTKKAASGISIR